MFRDALTKTGTLPIQLRFFGFPMLRFNVFRTGEIEQKCTTYNIYKKKRIERITSSIYTQTYYIYINI